LKFGSFAKVLRIANFKDKTFAERERERKREIAQTGNVKIKNFERLLKFH